MVPKQDMLKHLRHAIVGAMLASGHVLAADTDASSRCQTGPVEKTFGDSRWLVYSCDDGRSVSVVAAPGNPAAPFKFSLTAKANGHSLDGEGAGEQTAARAAYDELKVISNQEIESLVAQTKARK